MTRTRTYFVLKYEKWYLYKDWDEDRWTDDLMSATKFQTIDHAQTFIKNKTIKKITETTSWIEEDV